VPCFFAVKTPQSDASRREEILLPPETAVFLRAEAEYLVSLEGPIGFSAVALVILAAGRRAPFEARFFPRQPWGFRYVSGITFRARVVLGHVTMSRLREGVHPPLYFSHLEIIQFGKREPECPFFFHQNLFFLLLCHQEGVLRHNSQIPFFLPPLQATPAALSFPPPDWVEVFFLRFAAGRPFPRFPRRA